MGGSGRPRPGAGPKPGEPRRPRRSQLRCDVARAAGLPLRVSRRAARARASADQAVNRAAAILAYALGDISPKFPRARALGCVLALVTWSLRQSWWLRLGPTSARSRSACAFLCVRPG